MNLSAVLGFHGRYTAIQGLIASPKLSEVCKLLDIEKMRTTPQQPQSDGQVEHQNRTLIEMLRGKSKESQDDWDLQLPTCMMVLCPRFSRRDTKHAYARAGN